MSNRAKKSAKTSALRRAAGVDKGNKHVTKISAGSSRPKTDRPAETKTTDTAAKIHKVSLKSKSEQKALLKSEAEVKKAQAKSDKKSLENPAEKPLSEIFLLARPFVALGRYVRDSWRELRQVRWPNRKSTWKLTFAVLVYCAILMVFILILDLIFTFIFELILK